MKRSLIVPAILATCSGAALALPVIDGQVGTDGYGAPLWAQNQPTSFGNNVAGPGGTLGDPENVRKGVELAIPLAAIGNPAPGAIRLAGFVNGGGHDYLSNQVIGGTTTNAGNFGEPRNVNFATSANAAGNQFINLAPATVGGTVASPLPAPTMDGDSAGPDAAYYGGYKWVQNNFTGFGNNNTANGIKANGSEIDAVFACVWNNNTEADATDDVLYVVVAGNLESNFNKLDLFFDTIAGGQNRLLGINPNVDYDGLNRMGEFPAGTGGNGLTFDAGFEADFWVACTHGGTATDDTIYVNYGELLTAGGGIGGYVGAGTLATVPVSGSAVNNPGGAVAGGAVGMPALLCSMDNSNVAGVSGSPSGLSLPHPDYANGSEIDAVYGMVRGDSLYLLVSGNLETGWQHLELFFDADSTQVSPEGQNRLRGDNVDVSFNALNRMGEDLLAPGNGLTFDTGFTADYWISIGNGGYPAQNYADCSVLRLNGPDRDASLFILDYAAWDGGEKSTHNPITFSGPRRDVQDQSVTDQIQCNYGPRTTRLIADNPTGIPTPGLIEVSINNNNVAGVTGIDAAPSVIGADAVATGVEFRIKLSELGWDHASPIKVAGFINGSAHDYVSNQLIGGIPGFVEGNPATASPDLGEVRAISFAAIAGDQFVTIIPPSAADLDDGSATGTPDGGVDINDLLYFLAMYEAGDVAADLDDGSGVGIPDGGVDINDLLFFLAHYEAGC